MTYTFTVPQAKSLFLELNLGFRIAQTLVLSCAIIIVRFNESLTQDYPDQEYDDDNNRARVNRVLPGLEGFNISEF